MSGSIPLSTAIEGFFRYMRAVGRSPHTISDYGYTFQKLTRYFPDDPEIGSLTKDKLVGFFAWLQEDYISQPKGRAKVRRGAGPSGQPWASPKSAQSPERPTASPSRG